MTCRNANEVFKEIFESLLSRYQIRLETPMKGSDFNFIFDGVSLLYYQRYKINFKCGGSNIDSPDWIKTKKTPINPKSKNDKYFQYAATVVLNVDEIKKDPGRVSNIKPFINKDKWDGIKDASKIDDWKTFE